MVAKKAPKRTAKKPTKARARKAKRENIICGAHGETPVTYVCRHIAGGIACGFHARPPTPDNPWPDAWCDLCNEAFEAAGGEWNEQNGRVPQIKLLCTHCYDEARDRNSEVPELARGAATKLTDEEAAALIHHAVHEAQALQDTADKQWQWRDMAHWQLDEEARTITFTDPSRPPLVADVHFVGSYSTRSNTFQWAWETFDEDAPEAEAISLLRTFGEVRGISSLTTPNWTCEEAEGWEMTALAAHILGADGVYRAPIEHVRWFMLLFNWRTPN